MKAFGCQWLHLGFRFMKLAGIEKDVGSGVFFVKVGRYFPTIGLADAHISVGRESQVGAIFRR
jgi:hypothetical protein